MGSFGDYSRHAERWCYLRPARPDQYDFISELENLGVR